MEMVRGMYTKEHFGKTVGQHETRRSDTGKGAVSIVQKRIDKELN